MIKVVVPATTANVLVGFDALGMALDFSATYQFESHPNLAFEGVPSAYQNEEHLVVKAFRYACQQMGQTMPNFKLTVDLPIPYSRGLGSSATMVVAGLMAATAWFQEDINKMQLYQWACQLEGHGDNVAPAIFGGATVSFPTDTGYGFQLIPLANWYSLLVLSDVMVDTHQARQVLPQTIPYQDAVAQVGHALGFVQALQSGNTLALQQCAKDVLHEPYRKALIPHYDIVKKLAKEQNCVAMISGSGSTMLALADNAADLLNLSLTLERDHQLQTRLVKPSKKGAFVYD